MTMKWFENCQNIEDAKEHYKKLCREYHPDLNESDTTEVMKLINAEFEQVFKILKNKHRSESTDTTTNSMENGAETTETPAEFMTIINTLVSCEGLKIELVGRWIWLTGNTYQHRNVIKGLGFRWANAKKAWYFRNEKDACKSRKKLSLDEIKNKYGCQSFATVSTPKLAAV